MGVGAERDLAERADRGNHLDDVSFSSGLIMHPLKYMVFNKNDTDFWLKAHF